MKRTTCDGQKREGDFSIQLYSGSVSISHIRGACVLSRSSTLFQLCFNIVPETHKGNIRHVMARKGRRTSLYNCTVEVCQLPTFVVPVLSVRAMYSTENKFIMFSRDLSRSLTLLQYLKRTMR